MTTRPAVERVLDRTRKEGDCLVFTGATAGGGYGRISIRRGVVRQAHRVVYEALVGPIPDGLDLMHSCDNPPCVNIEHLAPGTRAKNLADCVARGRHPEASQTHCFNGHEYTLDNTYVHATSGQRICRTCQLSYQRTHYWRNHG